ncbi:MAG: AMP-binding protein [Bryobacterales bacterium]|nr:AMP-binding protein [Bryobacterales bacterium]
MPRETLLDFFHDFAALDHEFLIYDDGFHALHYRYREIAGQAQAFAARLRDAEIGKDDKIILYGENRPEWVVALWGCLLQGVIAVPIDYRSSPEFVQRIDAIVGAQAILAGDEVTLAESPKLWKFANLNAAGAATVQPVPITKDQTAEIIFTSGATAEPKGVIITHRNILANIIPVEREVKKYLHYARPFAPIRFLNLLPLSHMFGQAMATFIPPMLPGVVVFMRGFAPAEILRQIRTRRISVLVSVPQILEILREHLRQSFPELQQLRTAEIHWLRRWWRYRQVHRLFGWKFWSFVVGAAPLPADLESFFSELGFLVIQGYGLTETAPIVTLNHPFHARKGSVGKPIAGVEVKIAPDGEILVRGENVTSGYFQRPEETARAFRDGWFHTGDIGELRVNGELAILGRKKEMIVTPEGLNVFPEDVEIVLKQQPGVRDAAVIETQAGGETTGGGETKGGGGRVQAVLILDSGADAGEVIRRANTRLADYQRVRSFSIWADDEFPRTEGTGKLKRLDIAKGAPSARVISEDLNVPLENLTSLERVERMVKLGLEESVVRGGAAAGTAVANPAATSSVADFPTWNRSALARAARRIFLPGFLLPLTRIFAHIRTQGLDNLKALEPPVIFASNHQSYMDVPAILAALPARWRYRVTPAMRKEFFEEHFHGRSFTNSLNYYLSTLFFDAFPIPQREPGALATLRYIGELSSDKWCVLIFPEGKMTDAGEISPFAPGVGMIASKLEIPVVPIRIEGLERVLHHTWKMAWPGRVRIAFGPALRLSGDNYLALARQVEGAVRKL